MITASIVVLFVRTMCNLCTLINPPWLLVLVGTWLAHPWLTRLITWEGSASLNWLILWMTWQNSNQTSTSGKSHFIFDLFLKSISLFAKNKHDGVTSTLCTVVPFLACQSEEQLLYIKWSKRVATIRNFFTLRPCYHTDKSHWTEWIYLIAGCC